MRIRSTSKKPVEPLTGVQKRLEDLLLTANSDETLLTALRACLAETETFSSEKVEFLQWIPVLDKFDSILEKSEEKSDELIIAILHTTSLLVDSCPSQKHLYNSFEYLLRLLEHRNPEVLLADLELLLVFSGSRVRTLTFVSKLKVLAENFSWKDESLSMISCCQLASNPKTIPATLRLEYFSGDESDKLVVIDATLNLAETEDTIFKQITDQYSVPTEHQFALLNRIRVSLACASPEALRLRVKIRIAALGVLSMSFESNRTTASSPVSVDHESIPEMIDILKSTSPTLRDIQVLCLKALTSIVVERSRHQALPTVLSNAAAQHGIIPLLMRRVFTNFEAVGDPTTIQFCTALLNFVHTLAPTSSVSSALNNSGVLSLLLPLISDRRKDHFPVVKSAMTLLDLMLQCATAVVTTFRDLGGPAVMVERIHYEAVGVFEATDESAMSDSNGAVPTQKLLESLLYTLAFINSTATTRREVTDEKLIASLVAVFTRPRVFGERVFETTVSLLTDIIHQDPNCLPRLLSAGVGTVVLDCLKPDRLPVSSKAISCLPSIIGALCLVEEGRTAVVAADPVTSLLALVGNPQFQPVMTSNTAQLMAGNVDELLRHNRNELLNCSMKGVVQLVDIVQTLPDTTQVLGAIDFAATFLKYLLSLEPDYVAKFVEHGGATSLLNLLTCKDIPISFTRSDPGRRLTQAFRTVSSVPSAQIILHLIKSASDALGNVVDSASFPALCTGKTALAQDDSVFSSAELLCAVLHGIQSKNTLALKDWTTPEAEVMLSRGARVLQALRWRMSTRIHLGPGPTPAASSTETTASSSAAAVDPSAAPSVTASLEQPASTIAATDAFSTISARADREDPSCLLEGSLKSLLSAIGSNLRPKSAGRDRARGTANLLLEPTTMEKSVALKLATCWLDLLKVPDDFQAIEAHRASYLLTSCDVLHSVLLDGKHPTPNATLVQAFQLAHGIDLLSEKLTDFVSVIVSEAEESASPSPWVAVVARILRLSDSLLTAGAESISFGPNFDGKGFLLELSNAIFESVKRLWETPLLPKIFSSTQTQSLVSILTHLTVPPPPPSSTSTAPTRAIIDFRQAAHRTGALAGLNPMDLLSGMGMFGFGLGPGGAGGAAAGAGAAPAAPPQRAAAAAPFTWLPQHTDIVQQLTDMGFEEERSRQALLALGAAGTVERAMEWILSHPANEDDEEDELTRAIALSMQGPSSEPTAAAASSASSSAPSAAAVEPTVEAKPEPVAVAPAPPIVVETPLTIREQSRKYALECTGRAVEIAKLFGGLSNSVANLLSSISKQRHENQPQDQSAQEDTNKSGVVDILIQALLDCGNDAACDEGCSRVAEVAAHYMNDGAKTTSPAFIKDLGREGRVFSGFAEMALQFATSPEHLTEPTTTPTSRETILSSLILILDAIIKVCQTTRWKSLGGGSDTFSGLHKEDPLRLQNLFEGVDSCLAVVTSSYWRCKTGPLHASLLVIARATCEHDVAAHFLSKGGVQALLDLPQSASFSGLADLCNSIFKHIIEDPNTLQVCMETDLTPLVARSRLSQLLTSNSDMFCRAPQIFAKSLSNIAHLGPEDGRRSLVLNEQPSPKTLMLPKKSQSDLSKILTALMNHVAQSSSASPSPTDTATVVAVSASAGNSSSTSSTAVPVSAKSGSNDTEMMDAPAEAPKPSYAILIDDVLRMLSDYVRWYPGAAGVVGKHSVHLASSGHHSSEAFIAILIDRFVAFEKKRVDQRRAGGPTIERNGKAQSLLISLFGVGSEVRRRLIAQVTKALKSVSASTPPSVSFPKVRALSNLLHAWLTSKTVTAAVESEVVRSLLQANCAAALSAAMSSLDLLHPHAADAFNATMRPLETLCRIGAGLDPASIVAPVVNEVKAVDNFPRALSGETGTPSRRHSVEDGRQRARSGDHGSRARRESRGAASAARQGNAGASDDAHGVVVPAAAATAASSSEPRVESSEFVEVDTLPSAPPRRDSAESLDELMQNILEDHDQNGGGRDGADDEEAVARIIRDTVRRRHRRRDRELAEAADAAAGEVEIEVEVESSDAGSSRSISEMDSDEDNEAGVADGDAESYISENSSDEGHDDGDEDDEDGLDDDDDDPMGEGDDEGDEGADGEDGNRMSSSSDTEDDDDDAGGEDGGENGLIWGNDGIARAGDGMGMHFPHHLMAIDDEEEGEEELEYPQMGLRPNQMVELRVLNEAQGDEGDDFNDLPARSALQRLVGRPDGNQGAAGGIVDAMASMELPAGEGDMMDMMQNEVFFDDGGNGDLQRFPRLGNLPIILPRHSRQGDTITLSLSTSIPAQAAPAVEHPLLGGGGALAQREGGAAASSANLHSENPLTLFMSEGGAQQLFRLGGGDAAQRLQNDIIRQLTGIANSEHQPARVAGNNASSFSGSRWTATCSAPTDVMRSFASRAEVEVAAFIADEWNTRQKKAQEAAEAVLMQQRAEAGVEVAIDVAAGDAPKAASNDSVPAEPSVGAENALDVSMEEAAAASEVVANPISEPSAAEIVPEPTDVSMHDEPSSVPQVEEPVEPVVAPPLPAPIEAAAVVAEGDADVSMADGDQDDEEAEELRAALLLSQQIDSASSPIAASQSTAEAGPPPVERRPSGLETATANLQGATANLQDALASLTSALSQAAGVSGSPVAAVAPPAAAVASSSASADAAPAAASSEFEIDPAFLAELPPDLRADILAQQEQNRSRQQQALTASAIESAVANGVDPEFLAALPPDLQAEIIRQNQPPPPRAAPAAAAGGAAGNAEDMDNASFIATLPPDVREEVLLTADEAFLASLPPALAAEAYIIRERALQTYAMRDILGGASRREREAAAGGAGAHVSLVPGRGAGWHGLIREGGLPAARSRPEDRAGHCILVDKDVELICALLFAGTPLSKGSISKSLLQKLMQHLLINPALHNRVVTSLLSIALPVGGPSGTDSCCTLGLGPWSSLKATGLAWPADGSAPVAVSRRALELLAHLTKHNSSFGRLLLSPVLLNSSTLSELSALSGGRLNQLVIRKRKATMMLTDGGGGGGGDDGGNSSTETGFDDENENVPFLRLCSLLDTVKGGSITTNIELLVTLLSQVLQHVPVEEKASPIEGAVAAAEVAAAPAVSSSSSSSEPAAAGAKSDQETASVSTVAARSPIFRIPERSMRGLARVATLESCTDTTTQKLSNIFQVVSRNAENRQCVIRVLSSEAEQLAAVATVEMQSVVACLERSESDPLLSMTSTDVKLLRVLKILQTHIEALATDSTESLLPSQLDTLWSVLGACMTHLRPAPTAKRSNSVSPTLARLLPLIEAFFVISKPQSQSSVDYFKRSQSFIAPPAAVGSSSSVADSMSIEPVASSTPRSPVADAEASESAGAADAKPVPPIIVPPPHELAAVSRLVEFAERHGAALNCFIRQTPALLTGSMSALAMVPKLLDFDNKRTFFRREMRKRNEGMRPGTMRISVRRDSLLEDSYHQIAPRTPEEMRARINITFQGEEGIDAGGVSREWFLLLSRQMLNPDIGLFTHSAASNLTYQPNTASYIFGSDHLKYFKFIGRILGKAVYDGQLLEAHLTRSMYKHMLGLSVLVSDVDGIDPEYYKSLVWILENDITDVLDLTFSLDTEEFGERKVVDLKPNGRNIPVTEANKREYVQLVAEQRMTTGIKAQLKAFLQGFHELVPPTAVSIFTPHELELLMCGLPDIDLEDLRANTDYTGYTLQSPQIQWFWQCVREMPPEDVARLVQFVTGTSKVPLEGFAALYGMSGPQRFSIHRARGADRLPSSHTCFNQLDLPEYTSYEQLRNSINLAIREGTEGFGFG